MGVGLKAFSAFQPGTQYYKCSPLSAPIGLEAWGGAEATYAPGCMLSTKHADWQHCDEQAYERWWLSAGWSALHREQEGHACLSTCQPDCESLKLKIEEEREKFLDKTGKQCKQ